MLRLFLFVERSIKYFLNFKTHHIESKNAGEIFVKSMIIPSLFIENY